MAENNENALQRVEMSAEEYAAFQEFQAARAKEAAQNRVNALRENYQKMAESFVARTIKKLTPLSESIRQKKADVLDEAAALQNLKSQLLEIDGKSMPKSHTFTSADGTKRVTVGVYETDRYDDTVEEGVAIVKEYIQGLAGDKNSAQLVEMVLTLLKPSANGSLKASSVVRLRQIADKSGDARFIEGVRIIEAAYRPTITRTYIRCEKREVDEKGGVVKDWEAIPLGMTDA